MQDTATRRRQWWADAGQASGRAPLLLPSWAVGLSQRSQDPSWSGKCERENRSKARGLEHTPPRTKRPLPLRAEIYARKFRSAINVRPQVRIVLYASTSTFVMSVAV